ncbi:MAG: pyridoxal-phosphate dependent enzyme, partial [Phycisphaerales bacterium]|nr:pyridoxal-phosphate dependent enzyme [Phycisphaerales bacterium]
YLTTGPEIWEDTGGRLDALVGGIGTGGTISGAGRYIREQAAKTGHTVRIICPDPEGSIYKGMFESGTHEPPSIYRVEGIGHDFMVDTLDFNVIDEVRNISDRDSFITARRLAREEGIFCGGSTGTAVFGALQVARELGPGRTVVCILCDSGNRYLSKCFDDDWMRDMGYLSAEDRLGTVRDVLKSKPVHVEFAEPDETLANVARRMNELGISQMPLVAVNGGPLLMVHESDLLQTLITGACSPGDPAVKAAKPLRGQVAAGDPISRVQKVFDEDNVAVVVENNRVTGIISKIDVVEFLAART